MSSNPITQHDADTSPSVPDGRECGDAQSSSLAQPGPGHLRILRPDASTQDGADSPGDAIPERPPRPAFAVSGLTAAALIAVALAHMATYSSVLIFGLRVRVDAERWSNLMILGLIAGKVLGVIVFPKALELLRNRRRAAAGVLPFAVILAAGAATHLPGYSAWEWGGPRAAISGIGWGVIGMGAFMLFFSVVPPGRRGVWYGAGLSLGFVWWRVMQAAIHGTGGAADVTTVAEWHDLLYVVQAATIAAMAALLGFGLPKVNNVRPPLRTHLADGGFLGQPRKGWRVAGRLAGTLFLYYVANGLLGASLFPAGPGWINSPESWPESWYVHVLVIAACPLFGWYVDRRRGGAKTLMGASAVFLVFAPILNSLADSPLLYSGILAAGSLAQFAMLITVITVLPGQGAGLAWYGAAYLFQSMLRIAPFIGFFLALKIPALNGGVALVLAMTAAVGLLFAVRSLEDAFDDAIESPDEPPVMPIGEPRVESAREALPTSGVLTVCRRYDLTPRECEVAGLFADGKTPVEISQQLNISEYTVKTHIRNIMGKMDVSSRNALMHKLLQEK
jgi:DNA-binding CsgD family transcriptional regulator